MKDLHIVITAVCFIVGNLMGYNLYTNSVEREFRREMYLECLRTVAVALKSEPNRISLPFCWGK